MEKPKITILTTQQNLINDIKKKVSQRYDIVPRVFDNIKDITKFKRDLKDNIIEILGINSGNIDTQLIIIDSTFVDEKGDDYFIDDDLFSDLPSQSNSALAMLLGGGIPVIVSPNKNKDFNQGWKIGKRGATILTSINLLDQLIKQSEDKLPYSRHTLEVENEFAKVYDQEELSGSATISALLWENDFVVGQIEDYIKHSTDNVKILDLGCGTGRFEEILLKNDVINQKIDSIYAVDFAPQYLVEAKQRLNKLLSKSKFKKIKFLRRVAESLQFRDNFFDIVIGSFGVVCFSKSYLTLQQIYNVLEPGGLVLLNGYNRDALTFDFDREMKKLTGHPASHFAIKIDREENIMYLGHSQIACFTFDSKGMETLLMQIGFKPKKGLTRTFPTLYGTSRKEYLKNFSHYNNNSAKKGNSKKRGKKEINDVASYENKNLIKDKFNSGFNETLYLMDTDLALVLDSRGFYFCSASNK